MCRCTAVNNQDTGAGRQWTKATSVFSQRIDEPAISSPCVAERKRGRMPPVGQSADPLAFLQEQINGNKVMVFSKTTCPFCAKVKNKQETPSSCSYHTAYIAVCSLYLSFRYFWYWFLCRRTPWQFNKRLAGERERERETESWMMLRVGWSYGKLFVFDFFKNPLLEVMGHCTISELGKLYGMSLLRGWIWL